MTFSPDALTPRAPQSPTPSRLSVSSGNLELLFTLQLQLVAGGSRGQEGQEEEKQEQQEQRGWSPTDASVQPITGSPGRGCLALHLGQGGEVWDGWGTLQEAGTLGPSAFTKTPNLRDPVEWDREPASEVVGG